MDPEIRHLRAICAIADAGSLSAAARRLGVSQPALSAQLRRVERIVGGELFVRSRSGVRPTELGERTVGRARLLLSELDDFLGGLRNSDGARPALLRMGSAHMECVGTMIHLVRTALAGVEVRLQVEPSAVVLTQSLVHDRLDLAVIATMDDHDVSVPAELSHRVLVPRLPIFVALSDAHPLAARPEIDLADLSEADWIRPPGAEDGSLASLHGACRRAGFAARVRYEAPSGGGRQLIASGHAVQLVEPGAVDSPGVAIRPLAGDPLHARLRLAWRPGRLTEAQARRVHRAAGRAYADHAAATPAYAPWWRAHPQAHPLDDSLRRRQGGATAT